MGLINQGAPNGFENWHWRDSHTLSVCGLDMLNGGASAPLIEGCRSVRGWFGWCGDLMIDWIIAVTQRQRDTFVEEAVVTFHI